MDETNPSKAVECLGQQPGYNDSATTGTKTEQPRQLEPVSEEDSDNIEKESFRSVTNEHQPEQACKSKNIEVNGENCLELDMPDNKNQLELDSADSKNQSELDDMADSKNQSELDDLAASKMPIDRGYAWVVVMAAFLSYGSTGCLWTSFSVMYSHYVELWDTRVSSVGLVISFYAAGLQFVGVFFGAAIEGRDVRLPGILGAVVSSVATFCAMFSPNVYMVALFYGLTGAGHSLVYLSVSSMVQRYFNLKRTLASGITLTGYSLAGFIYPPLSRYLLDRYGWQGTLLIFSGVHMQNIWLSALLRPVKTVIQKPHHIISDQDQRSRKCCCNLELKKIIHHLSLLRHPQLVFFLLTNLIFNIGYNGFFFHIVNRALYMGMDASVVAFLPTVSAITNLVWRPLFGLIATLLVKYINNIIVYGIAFIVLSVSIFVFTLVADLHWMIIVLVVFGLASASMAAVQHPSLVDLVGISNITGGIALLMVFCGIGQIAASPFAGWIYEVSHDYDVANYASASLVFVAACLCLVIFVISRCGQKEDIQRNG